MKAKLILLTTALLTLAACSSKPDTSGITMSPDSEGMMQLQVSNAELGERLLMSDTRTRTTNGLLEAAVMLQSQYSKTQYLQYQFIWYDSQGFKVRGSDSPWRALMLEGYGKEQLNALAPNAQATAFTLAVREVSTEEQEFED